MVHINSEIQRNDYMRSILSKQYTVKNMHHFTFLAFSSHSFHGVVFFIVGHFFKEKHNLHLLDLNYTILFQRRKYQSFIKIWHICSVLHVP